MDTIGDLFSERLIEAVQKTAPKDCSLEEEREYSIAVIMKLLLMAASFCVAEQEGVFLEAARLMFREAVGASRVRMQ